MDFIKNDSDLAPRSVVLGVARDFAAALAETPQFKAFEQAADRFRQDQEAQQVMQAYQQKQHALRALLMLNAVSTEEQAELERLHHVFVTHPIVQNYFEAQTELASLCQTLGDALSESLGLNYAAACGVSCCG